ncbi:MAG: DUF4198 domain-containing protein [Parvularculaceae bacterium]|nr:DUF4198 domain-containing protein [Parvularculaceae bacterium]
MMRRLFVASLAAAATLDGAAAAHDFWIDAHDWRLDAPGGEVGLVFSVGHAADAESWTLKPERSVELVSYGPDGRRDLQDALIYPTAGEKSGARLSLEGEGVHVIAFRTDDAFSELAAEKFNAYVAEEGLAPARAARRRAGGDKEAGREAYSRRAKALIRVGDATTEEAPAAVGHTLEITPLENPFSLEEGEPLRVRIDYQGAPLEGATVSLESLDVGLLPEARRLTGADGTAAFVFPHKGSWKMNVVWTRPLSPDERPAAFNADFETVFASLTFGY